MKPATVRPALYLAFGALALVTLPTTATRIPVPTGVACRCCAISSMPSGHYFTAVNCGDQSALPTSVDVTAYALLEDMSRRVEDGNPGGTATTNFPVPSLFERSPFAAAVPLAECETGESCRKNLSAGGISHADEFHTGVEPGACTNANHEICNVSEELVSDLFSAVESDDYARVASLALANPSSILWNESRLLLQTIACGGIVAQMKADPVKMNAALGVERLRRASTSFAWLRSLGGSL